MPELLITIVSALWLGILTSINPCPLATNVAAISFLSKKVVHPRAVLYSGLLYILGRVCTYTLLGAVIACSLTSVPVMANFLQVYMNRILGPLLILAGLVLLDIIKLRLPGISLSEKSQRGIVKAGPKGAFMLGVIFALSFCPFSAALFFGSLIPLALKSSYGIILPLFYGFGTGLPVFIFAVGISLGIASLTRWVYNLKDIELIARRITAFVFILVGLYYAWFYILKR